MSLGKNWRARLNAANALKCHAAQATWKTKEEEEAKEKIAQLQRNLPKEKDHQCFVMRLKEDQASVSFDQLRNKQYTSSKVFLGAARTVVEFCLENDLDVYVWEVDFKMSCGQIGAEIWVTPRGVPWH